MKVAGHLITRRSSRAIATIVALSALAGCRRDMQDQPRYQPLQASRFFTDGRASRPIPEGTVAQDELNDDDPVHMGISSDGSFLREIPLPVTKETLLRGQERFNIFCSECHGYLGDGDGMVARRGVKQPSNLHSARLRQAPPGYIFQVISHGYGAMMSYGQQIQATDRWAIVAYLHALQLSQSATIDDVPAADRQKLEVRP